MDTSILSGNVERHDELRAGMHASSLPVHDVPYRAMLTEHDVLTWHGTLVRLWRLDGGRAATLDATDLSDRNAVSAAPLGLRGAGEFAFGYTMSITPGEIEMQRCAAWKAATPPRHF